MAHSCIVSYNIKSAKFEYLFSSQRDLTQSLQQRMEESWVGRGRDILPFPINEAKNLIRQLRLRLVNYLLTVRTEIMINNNNDTDEKKNKKNSNDNNSNNNDDNNNNNNNNNSNSFLPSNFNDIHLNDSSSDRSQTGGGPTFFGNVFGNNIFRFDD